MGNSLEELKPIVAKARLMGCTQYRFSGNSIFFYDNDFALLAFRSERAQSKLKRMTVPYALLKSTRAGVKPLSDLLKRYNK